MPGVNENQSIPDFMGHALWQHRAHPQLNSQEAASACTLLVYRHPSGWVKLWF